MRRTLLALLALVCATTVVLFVPQAAQAHVERPSYWPDPDPDCSTRPCAGGKVPTIRTLRSALDTSKPGRTRVVCKADSLQILERSIRRARANGYHVRPTDKRRLTKAQADGLRSINRKLFKMCNYRQIQPAVTASGNQDRVVVMPGLYTEPNSRKQPTFDPRCDRWETKSDGGDPGAPSHEYQTRCPNDANLIAVIGRSLGKGLAGDPVTPRVDRHGIPNQGYCIRCNVQLEGSGVSADDVIVEAGSAKAGNGGPSAVGHKKDVGIFVDRADGFVLRKVTVRHAREHGIYVLETDGFRLDWFKAYYNGAYGVLTFVADHAVVSNCDTAGSGDSGIYPGSGAPTLVNRDESFYPIARISNRFTRCDSHHNTGGFSGTNSHGTLIDHNNFYDNALGYTTDVFTAAGHPGFPQEGNIVQNNNFYNNNFNPFKAGSDVVPYIPAPVGTGLWLAGGNENVVRNNNFFNNWRRGLMIFAVPDALVCGPLLTDGTPVPGCNPLGVSTSHGNRVYGNTMGVSTKGAIQPNGVDFWWDSFPTNAGNCWWGNKGPDGGEVTSSPGNLPNCADGTKPNQSIGLGDVANEAELVACFAGFELDSYPSGNDTVCDWAITPSKPTSSTRTTGTPEIQERQKQVFDEYCSENRSARTCAPYASKLDALSWLTTLLRPLLPAPKATPVASDERLSSFTCSWWRQADAGEKAGLVDRLQYWVGGKATPSEGGQASGYGNVLGDDRTDQLFDSRCSTSYAGGFALYKIYGAAAAFAGING